MIKLVPVAILPLRHQDEDAPYSYDFHLSGEPVPAEVNASVEVQLSGGGSRIYLIPEAITVLDFQTMVHHIDGQTGIVRIGYVTRL